MRLRLEFAAATAVRGWRRRANFCDASFFFESYVTLSCASRERSCTFVQNWYRTSTHWPESFGGCALLWWSKVRRLNPDSAKTAGSGTRKFNGVRLGCCGRVAHPLWKQPNSVLFRTDAPRPECYS